MSKAVWTLVSIMVSILIVVPGTVFLPTDVEKSIALILGLGIGAAINLVAGKASVR